MTNLGELIEKLSIANTKLFKEKDWQQDVVFGKIEVTKEELIKSLEKDINLCQERARLKNEINKATNNLQINEIKNYG